MTDVYVEKDNVNDVSLYINNNHMGDWSANNNWGYASLIIDQNSNFQNIHEISQDTFNRVNDLGHHVIGSICDMAVPVYNSYTNSNSGNPIPSPKWYPYCDVKNTEDNILIRCCATVFFVELILSDKFFCI